MPDVFCMTEDIQRYKECVMTAFPEKTVTDPDDGHPFGQESSDISYLWGKGHEDTADYYFRGYTPGDKVLY